MYRTKTCGELRLADAGQTVTISGWVQRIRKMGGMTFVDIRDRYGITQVVFNNEVDAALCEEANHLGREFVVQITGKVAERYAKNPEMPTGDIEIEAQTLTVLNRSEVPPFTIEDESDGGDDIRMKYRYLDLRRPCVRANIELRHRMTMEVRRYLDSKGFLEIETPMLVGSTPEGARDFVVPSRMNPGQFYALPQSPQTLKQLLMVSGMDRYFQIVKCFRDEDLRADRQPEFTQIDCEMSFVNQDDIINLFEGMAKHLFKELRGVELTEPFIRMPWADAMRLYGSDKPDLRFGMTFVELMDVLKGHGFSVFDNAAYIGGICVTGAASYTRKQLDQLTDFVKRPQIGAKGMVYARVEADGNVKSSVDKFYTQETLQELKKAMNAQPGDLILILSGDDVMKTRKQLCELRLEMGRQLGLRDKNKFAC
ncbi:aspartate--tRNA ligase, partial [Muribaculum intestinale]